MILIQQLTIKLFSTFNPNEKTKEKVQWSNEIQILQPFHCSKVDLKITKTFWPVTREHSKNNDLFTKDKHKRFSRSEQVSNWVQMLEKRLFVNSTQRFKVFPLHLLEEASAEQTFLPYKTQINYRRSIQIDHSS